MGQTRRSLDEVVTRSHKRLLANNDTMLQLEKRGISAASVTSFRLGYRDNYLCIPLHDDNGKLVNVKQHSMRGQTPKSKYISSGVGSILFGVHLLKDLHDNAEVLLCEGELDAIAATEKGFCAVSGTGGAGTFKNDWRKHFHGKRVVIIYDTDEAGREGAQKVVEALASDVRRGYIRSVKNILLPFPDNSQGNDISDWFKAGNSAEQFRQLIAEAAEVDVFSWPAVEPLDLCRRDDCPFFEIDRFLAATPQFKNYVTAVGDALQVPYELPAMISLSLVSLTLCGAAVIELKNEWREHPPIWTLLLLPPGNRKSPVLKILIGPIHRWRRDQEKQFRDAIAAQQQRLAIGEKRIGALEKEAAREQDAKKRDAKSKEAQDLKVRLESEELLRLPQLITNDSTAEAICELLRANGERLGIISSEADTLDIILGRYSDGKGNFGIFLCAYGAEPYQVNRRSRESILLQAPLIVVALAIQPEAVRELLSSSAARGRGLVARCLPIEPPSLQGQRPFDTPQIPVEMEVWWNEMLNKLLSLPRPNDPLLDTEPIKLRGGEVSAVTLTDRAREVFRNLHGSIEPELADFGEMEEIRDFGGKLMGHIARIALALHFLRGKGVDDQIEEETMRSAVAFCDFLKKHFKRLVASAAQSVQDGKLERALKWIKAKGYPGFNFSTFYNALRTSRHSKAEDWEGAITALSKKNYIREAIETAKRAGRPARAYEVNPAILTPDPQNPQNPQNLGPANAAAGDEHDSNNGPPPQNTQNTQNSESAASDINLGQCENGDAPPPQNTQNPQNHDQPLEREVFAGSAGEESPPQTGGTAAPAGDEDEELLI